MKMSISRDDLARMQFQRHVSECLSIITYLGIYVNYDDVRTIVNKHLDNLVNG